MICHTQSRNWVKIGDTSRCSPAKCPLLQESSSKETELPMQVLGTGSPSNYHDSQVRRPAELKGTNLMENLCPNDSHSFSTKICNNKIMKSGALSLCDYVQCGCVQRDRCDCRPL